MSTNVARAGVEARRPRRMHIAAAGLAIAIAVGAGYVVSHDDVTATGPDSSQAELDQHRHVKPDGFIPASAWARRYEEYTAR